MKPRVAVNVNVFRLDGSWLLQWQTKNAILRLIVATAHFTLVVGYPAERRWEFYDKMEDETGNIRPSLTDL